MPSMHRSAESIWIFGVTGGRQEFSVLEAKVSLTGNKWEGYWSGCDWLRGPLYPWHQLDTSRIQEDILGLLV